MRKHSGEEGCITWSYPLHEFCNSNTMRFSFIHWLQLLSITLLLLIFLNWIEQNWMNEQTNRVATMKISSGSSFSIAGTILFLNSGTSCWRSCSILKRLDLSMSSSSAKLNSSCICSRWKCTGRWGDDITESPPMIGCQRRIRMKNAKSTFKLGKHLHVDHEISIGRVIGIQARVSNPFRQLVHVRHPCHSKSSNGVHPPTGAVRKIDAGDWFEGWLNAHFMVEGICEGGTRALPSSSTAQAAEQDSCPLVSNESIWALSLSKLNATSVMIE